MLKAIREFHVGRPQILAGILLLAFLAECVWIAARRPLAELEYQYIASGYVPKPGQEYRITSPVTGFVASLPFRANNWLHGVTSNTAVSAIPTPPPLAVRLPFIIFGVWLGAALWWVARRLFGNEGGYIALASYCFSAPMVEVSSNAGPEIILAWSLFGLIYTAIGVSHTVYSPPGKWLPRIVLLGLAIGISISAQFWSFTLILLALAFMLYLSPGQRKKVAVVFGAGLAIGVAILCFFRWMTHSFGLGSRTLITPHFSWGILRALGSVTADGYALVALLVLAGATYGSWSRARYFGNTAPLLTAAAICFLFAMVPAIYLFNATLALCFLFVFIGGVAADLLETPYRRLFLWVFSLLLTIKAGEAVFWLTRWLNASQA